MLLSRLCNFLELKHILSISFIHSVLRNPPESFFESNSRPPNLDQHKTTKGSIEKYLQLQGLESISIVHIQKHTSNREIRSNRTKTDAPTHAHEKKSVRHFDSNQHSLLTQHNSIISHSNETRPNLDCSCSAASASEHGICSATSLSCRNYHFACYIQHRNSIPLGAAFHHPPGQRRHPIRPFFLWSIHLVFETEAVNL